MSGRSTDAPSSAADLVRRLAAGLARGTGHVIAVAVVAGLGLVPWHGEGASRAVRAALAEGALVGDTLGHLALHCSIASLFWWAIYSAGRGLLVDRRDGAPRLASSGTVVLETLIVLPVALVLLMGLMQFAVLNIASMMTKFAAYEASRAAWIWEGERGAGRSDVGADGSVDEYARIQAAMVLTPVAPGSFHIENERGVPSRAREARAMFLAANNPVPFEDSGANVRDRGRYYGTVRNRQGATSDLTATRALGRGTMPTRTARQFTWAFLATDIAVSDADAPRDFRSRSRKMTVTLTYHHMCAFPWVARIFGKSRRIHGRAGYYAEFEESVERHRQLPASEEWPHWKRDEDSVERPIDYF